MCACYYDYYKSVWVSAYVTTNYPFWAKFIFSTQSPEGRKLWYTACFFYVGLNLGYVPGLQVENLKKKKL